jgi:hypothetical protein
MASSGAFGHSFRRSAAGRKPGRMVRARDVINPRGLASKRRFFEKSAQKTSFAWNRRSGGEGRASKPGAKRRHEVFLLLFVHKKKIFLASLPWAPTPSATRAKRLFSRRTLSRALLQTGAAPPLLRYPLAWRFRSSSAQ